MTKSIRTYSNNKPLVSKRRKQIIECAITLFRRKGYQNTTTRELAAECGMSEGNLYRYIGAKNDILHLMAIDAIEWRDSLRKQFNEFEKLNPVEALRRLIKVQARRINENQDRLIFLNAAMRTLSSDDRRALLEGQALAVSYYERIIKKGIESGEFKADSPFLVAQNINGVIQDWALRRWLIGRSLTLTEYVKLQTELALKMLAVDGKKIKKNKNRKKEYKQAAGSLVS